MMALRKWHRWIALPAALFLLFIAATGILLHADMMWHGNGPPGSEPMPEPTLQPIPSDTDLAAMIAMAADAARRNPEVTAAKLQVNLAGDRITVGVGDGSPFGGIMLDAATGEAIAPPAPPADYHYVLQDLHAGYFAGWTGRIVSILAGLCLIVLAVTGLQLWWSMKRRGKKRGLFWN